MKKVLPQSLDTREAYKLLVSMVAPRPIAFVSTINKNGLPNAAPFCFFMGVTPVPLTVAFSIMRRGDQKKDTICNIETTRDFVINIVDEKLCQTMNMASGSYPSDMSEFDVTGLTPLQSEKITSPRIAESLVQLECKLLLSLELGTVPTSLVIGEVVCVHIHESVYQNGLVDVKQLKPIGRVSENLYARFTDFFEMNRPA